MSSATSYPANACPPYQVRPTANEQWSSPATASHTQFEMQYVEKSGPPVPTNLTLSPTPPSSYNQSQTLYSAFPQPRARSKSSDIFPQSCNHVHEGTNRARGNSVEYKPRTTPHSAAPPRSNQHHRVLSDMSVGRTPPAGTNFFDLASINLEQLSAPTTPTSSQHGGVQNTDVSSASSTPGENRISKNKVKSGKDKRKKSKDKNKTSDSLPKVLSSLHGQNEKDQSASTPTRFFPRRRNQHHDPAQTSAKDERAKIGSVTTPENSWDTSAVKSVSPPRHPLKQSRHSRVKSEMPARMVAKQNGGEDSNTFVFDQIWNDDFSSAALPAAGTGAKMHPLSGPVRSTAANSPVLNNNDQVLKECTNKNVVSALAADPKVSSTKNKPKKSGGHRRASSLPIVNLDVSHLLPAHRKKSCKSQCKEILSALSKKKSNDDDPSGLACLSSVTDTSCESMDLINSGIIPTTTHTSNSAACSAHNNMTTKNAQEIVLRSCELEPSLHQVELPSSNDVLMYARIASLADTYRVVDQNFDFASLAGFSRLEMEGFCSGAAPAAPTMSDISGDATPEIVGRTGLVSSHRPIVQSILECAEDAILQKFFAFGQADEDERVEVAIFSSQKHRQFIVSYRGTTDQQHKPIRGKHIKQKEEGGGASILHKDHPVPVNPAFKAVHFGHDMENKVFDALNNLASEYPFFDCVMTGHSFGAALAMISAIRYASLFPMMRVSAIVFGCPRIGGAKFRELANSLPNLKIMRVEHGEDQWVVMPEGPKWDHAGHSIVINPSLFSISSTPTGAKSSSSAEQNPDSSACVLAYRFDKKHPGGGGQNFGQNLMMNIAKMSQWKNDVGMAGYVHAMEKFTHLGLPWVTSFVGEEGGGVSGSNKEKRHVV